MKKETIIIITLPILCAVAAILAYIKLINTLDPNELIKKLSKYNIKKLLVEEATIEDIFMEYL